MSGKNHRQCKLGTNSYENSSSEENDRDPFETSDDANDPDYQAPKKPRLMLEPSGVLKQLFGKNRRNLTAQQRIARINKKYKPTSTLKQLDLAHSSNQMDFAEPNNKIDDSSNSQTTANQIELSKVEKFESVGLFDNHDHFFDFENIDHGKGVKYGPEPTGTSLTNESPATNEVIMGMLLKLQDSHDELLGKVDLLRKQVSRLEMKSLGLSTANKSDSQISIPIQPEHLLDFDATLAQEGLPIGTCVELNEFEMKLKRDSEYKEKLVRIFLHFLLSLICLLACIN